MSTPRPDEINHGMGFAPRQCPKCGSDREDLASRECWGKGELHPWHQVRPEGVAAPLEPSRQEFVANLEREWMAQGQILDFRNWLIEKLWAAAAVSKNLQQELAHAESSNKTWRDLSKEWEELCRGKVTRILELEKEITALRETK